MELKSLFLGLVFSVGIFAVKAGSGLVVVMFALAVWGMRRATKKHKLNPIKA